MNELLFFIHVFLVIGFVLGALRLGKAALIALSAVQAVLANLFVVKQIDLFGFSITCSDVFAVGGILSINLIQEYFGKEAAKLGMQISLLSLFFFAAMSQIHLVYTPSLADGTQSSFFTIFSSTPRIVFASVVVFYVVQKVDIQLFGWMKKIFEGRRLSFRIGTSLVISQFLDTVLFSFLGLYGIVDSISDVVFISFFVKCFIIAFSSSLAAFSKRFVKEIA
jgi:hypothetical protein